MFSEKLWGRRYHPIPQELSQDERSHVLSEYNRISQPYDYPASGSCLSIRRWTLPSWWKRQAHARYFLGHGRFYLCYNHRRLCSRLVFLFTLAIYLLVIVLATTATCFPSYSNPPTHYSLTAKRCKATGQLGCANVYQEKVFIAASILDKDGKLIKGPWGQAVLRLIDIIGPENVFLSIYENGAAATTKPEIRSFASKLTCNSSIVNEQFDFGTLPSVSLPNGERRVKRIAYLADVRNRALLPLDDGSSHNNTRFDKLLYLNDVMFNPIDAAQLLFSTNVEENGRTNYRSACAVDFINPFKFYDTFATRDFMGNNIGLPFFPWFSAKEMGYSRKDVLDQKDAVRVRSCWGGMVAFEAKWFQMDNRADSTLIDADLSSANHLEDVSSKAATFALDSQQPLRFRYEDELFWESSECCLIQADLQSRAGNLSSSDTGIFINPFVRVAYDEHTLAWLPFTRRFERLYSIVHYLLNVIIDLPRQKERRDGEVYAVTKEPMKSSEGSITVNGRQRYHYVQHVGKEDSFCSSRKLLVLEGFPPTDGSHWYKIPAPSS